MDEEDAISLFNSISEDFGIPWLGNETDLCRERIRLYEKDYSINEKIDLGREALKYLKTTRKLRLKIKDVIGELHKKMKKIDEYQQLTLTSPLTSRFVSSATQKAPTLPTLEIYPERITDTYSTGWFVSIDMVEAGFTALRILSPKLTFETERWADMMKKVTVYKYIQNAPMIRHIALSTGIACPVCQRTVMKWILCEIGERLNGLIIKDTTCETKWGIVNADEIGHFVDVDIPSNNKVMREQICDDIRENIFSQITDILDKYGDEKFSLKKRLRFTVSKIKHLRAFYNRENGTKEYTDLIHVRETVFSSLLDGSLEENNEERCNTRVKGTDKLLIPQATRFITSGICENVSSDLIFKYKHHVCRLSQHCSFEWFENPTSHKPK